MNRNNTRKIIVKVYVYTYTHIYIYRLTVTNEIKTIINNKLIIITYEA